MKSPCPTHGIYSCACMTPDPKPDAERASEAYSEVTTRGYYSDEFDRDIVRGAMQAHFLAGCAWQREQADKEVAAMDACATLWQNDFVEVSEKLKLAEAALREIAGHSCCFCTSAEEARAYFERSGK